MESTNSTLNSILNNIKTKHTERGFVQTESSTQILNAERGATELFNSVVGTQTIPCNLWNMRKPERNNGEIGMEKASASKWILTKDGILLVCAHTMQCDNRKKKLYIILYMSHFAIDWMFKCDYFPCHFPFLLSLSTIWFVMPWMWMDFSWVSIRVFTRESSLSLSLPLCLYVDIKYCVFVCNVFLSRHFIFAWHVPQTLSFLLHFIPSVYVSHPISRIYIFSSTL